MFSRQARQYICAYFKVWKDLDKQQDDRMDAKVDTTTYEADPSVLKNTPLCPQFRHNFLQGNLFLQSNIVNNRATKQKRSKQQNEQT